MWAQEYMEENFEEEASRLFKNTLRRRGLNDDGFKNNRLLDF